MIRASIKLQIRKERDSVKRLSQREISELRKALEDLSSRSADVSRANRELREKMSELGKVVSNRKARLRDQKTQLKQHLDNRAALGISQKIETLCDSRPPEPPEWERWRSTMQCWETKSKLACIASGYKPGGTYALTHLHTQQDVHTVECIHTDN